jgi:hypothetical protein
VDAVERRLPLDLLALAAEVEAGVGDLDLEVLLEAPAVPDRTDGEPDFGAARERAPLDTRGDLFEGALGGLQELLALAGALSGHARVAADVEPLVGVVARGDLGQVLLVEQRALERAVLDQPLELGGP